MGAGTWLWCCSIRLYAEKRCRVPCGARERVARPRRQHRKAPQRGWRGCRIGSASEHTRASRGFWAWRTSVRGCSAAIAAAPKGRCDALDACAHAIGLPQNRGSTKMRSRDRVCCPSVLLRRRPRSPFFGGVCEARAANVARSDFSRQARQRLHAGTSPNDNESAAQLGALWTGPVSTPGPGECAGYSEAYPKLVESASQLPQSPRPGRSAAATIAERSCQRGRVTRVRYARDEYVTRRREKGADVTARVRRV